MEKRNNPVITAVDDEKTFDKIQYPFKTKTLSAN